jgi:hypothetical protein
MDVFNSLRHTCAMIPQSGTVVIGKHEYAQKGMPKVIKTSINVNIIPCSQRMATPKHALPQAHNHFCKLTLSRAQCDCHHDDDDDHHLYQRQHRPLPHMPPLSKKKKTDEQQR